MTQQYMGSGNSATASLTRMTYARTNASVYDHYGNRTAYSWSEVVSSELEGYRITTVLEPLGVQTSYQYDSIGRVQRVTDHLSRYTDVTWDSTGRLASIDTPSPTSSTRLQYSITYDPRPYNKTLVTQVTGPRGLEFEASYRADSRPEWVKGLVGLPTYFTYHDGSNASQGLVGDLKTVSYASRTTALEWTPRGEIKKVTSPGAPGSSASRISEALYDNLSRPYETTLPAGTRTFTTYDPMGLVLTSGLRYPTYDLVLEQLQYDTEGRVRFRSNPNAFVSGTWSWTYDSLDRVITAKNPLNQTSTFTYDRLGNITESVDPAGVRVVTRYSAGLRPVDRSWYKQGVSLPGGSTRLAFQSWSYIPTRSYLVSRSSISHDQAGISSIEDYYYDTFGNQIGYAKDDSSTSGIEEKYSWSFNQYGQTQALFDDLRAVPGQTVPSTGASREWHYDTFGRLSQLWHRIGVTNTHRRYQYSYDSEGRLNNETELDGGSGAMARNYTFSSQDGSLSTVALSRAGMPVESRSFLYNPMGQVIQEQVTSADVPAPYMNSYVYHPEFGYLMSAVKDGGLFEYNYDNSGNRTFANTPMGRYGFVYNGANRLTTVNALNSSNQTVASMNATHDGSGNLTQLGSDTFTWDVWGNLKTSTSNAQTTNYAYDTDGRLVTTSGAGPSVSKKWLGWEETNTSDADSAGVDSYYRNPSDGSWPLQDSIGSVVGKVNSSGSIVGRQSFGPFGEEAAGNNASGNGKGFTGRDRVGNGLLYFRNRMYSPLLGRFVSEDPLGWGAGSNFFAYSHNDPVNFNDPLGLWESDPLGCGRGDACAYGGGIRPVPYGRPENYAQRRALVEAGMSSALISTALSMDMGNHGSPNERLSGFGGRGYFRFTGGRGSYGGGKSRPRVRHFTGKNEIKDIKRDKQLKASEPNGLFPSAGKGVDVEAQPFGPTRRGANNPHSAQSRLGAADDTHYVEFDLPEEYELADFTRFTEPWTSYRIKTNDPLDISSLNPEFRSTPPKDWPFHNWLPF